MSDPGGEGGAREAGGPQECVRVLADKPFLVVAGHVMPHLSVDVILYI